MDNSPLVSLDNLRFLINRSPFDIAWTYIFDTSRDEGFLRVLQSLFPITDDYLEERQFSKLHNIVLGITLHDLKVELAISRVDIDRRDSSGFTPLMWAARRGDYKAVSFLLEAKANPNIHNSFSSSALICAARSSLACVRLLLEAGADPTHNNNEDYNALHFATETQDSKETIECLVAAGVNLHGQNMWGSVPISQAAIINRAFSAEALLDCGADIDSRDNDGDTPLHESVFRHADDVMRLLLNRGAKYTLLFHGGSILHLAALSGRLRTLEILRAAGLNGLNPDLINRQGKKPLQLAQERVTNEEDFVQTFQTLLYEIRIRNASEARSSSATSDTASEDIFTDAIEDPSQTSFPNLSSTASSGFSRWTRPSLTDWIIRKLGLTRTREWFAEFQNRFARSRWMAFMIYWILGLGWAGFFYMILLSRRGESGELAEAAIL
ncbi:hypothetical protein MMC14_003644 [Varicellaria rhodocarpa]|nr:hypothetical protein [Varicellaria rhodocarpa]